MTTRDKLLLKLMPKTAEFGMAVIREILSTAPNYHSSLLNFENSEANKFWKVMSAFRGPDNEDFFLKQATTGIIRLKVLGKKICETMGLTAIVDGEKFKERRLSAIGAFSHKPHVEDYQIRHHIYHAKEAFKHLNLKWEENNNVQ